MMKWSKSELREMAKALGYMKTMLNYNISYLIEPTIITMM